MSVQSQIDRINGEVSTQTDLIARLGAILFGKVGGIIPSGAVSISKNGTFDVTKYARAVVDVPSLPDGIIAMNTGSFQLDLARGESEEIKHGLTVAPNFYIVFADPGINADELANTAVLVAATQHKIIADGETIPVCVTNVHVDANGYFEATTSGEAVASRFSSTHIKIYGPLKSSVKYRWLAGHFAQIE